MRPYRRRKKPVRHIHNDHFGPWFERASKATGSLWEDIQTIWLKDPPFPASVRILCSASLALTLVLPLLYFLVPPIITIIFSYMVYYEEFPIFSALPKLPPVQRQYIYKSYRELFKKATFRLSMLVTIYDYIQTFRALGGFNFRQEL